MLVYIWKNKYLTVSVYERSRVGGVCLYESYIRLNWSASQNKNIQISTNNSKCIYFYPFLYLSVNLFK